MRSGQTMPMESSTAIASQLMRVSRRHAERLAMSDLLDIFTDMTIETPGLALAVAHWWQDLPQK